MKVYDYIIVGAGTAGCVIASRLTEDPEVSVLLLEAGPPDDDPAIHVPALLGDLYLSAIDWQFFSEPEPALDGKRVYLPRGRTFGGTSSLNGMIYIRGNSVDYDRWAEEAAAPDWSFANIEKYFERAEAVPAPSDGIPRGSLTVSDVPHRFGFMDAWLETAHSAGYAANADFNSGEQLGVGPFRATQRNGRRWSAAAGYLRPALARPNLTVMPNTLVSQILIEGGRARGVEARQGAVEFQAFAEREVVLSAGAYNSPQILMLSGIGPEAHLRSMGVTVRADLPVGDNLMDHQAVGMVYTSDTRTLFSARDDEAWAEFAAGYGPLSSSIGEVGGFFLPDSAGVPQIETVVVGSMMYEENLGEVRQDGFSVLTCGLAPASRGTVRLRNARPDSKVRISHQYLADPFDRDVLEAGLELNYDIAQRSPFRDWWTSTEQGPRSNSASDRREYVASHTYGLYHPAGTCAIGTVVDTQLRVFGVESLRVADASVFPLHVSGNPQAAVVMVAEKIADLLRGGI